MKTLTATLLIAISVAVSHLYAAFGSTNPGMPQATNPTYLSQFPTVETVEAVVRGSDPIDTAARQMSAFITLKVIIVNLAATRFERNGILPDEQRLMDVYMDEWSHVYDVAVTPRDKERLDKLSKAYLTDPELSVDKMLQRLFPPDFRASYYRVTHKQPPEPTAAEIWKETLRKGETFSSKDDFFIHFSAVLGGARIYCSNSLSVEAYPFSAETQNGRVVVTIALTPKPWSFELQRDESLRSLGIGVFSWKDGKKCNVDVLTQDVKKPSENAQSQPAAQKITPPPVPVATSARAYLIEGDKYRDRQDYAKAIEAYKKAISIEPSSRAYNELGIAYTVLKQYPDAVAALQQAIGLKPDDPAPRANLGYAYLWMEQYETAKGPLREAIRLKPDDADAISGLGVSHFRLKQYQQAAALFQQAVVISPNEGRFYHNLGKTYFFMGRKAEAREIYKKLLTIDKDWAQQLYDAINKGAGSQPAPNSGSATNRRPGSPAGPNAAPLYAEINKAK